MRSVLLVLVASAAAAADAPSVDLDARFDPDRHTIDCVASLPFPKDTLRLSFLLNPALSCDEKAQATDGFTVRKVGPGLNGWTEWEVTSSRQMELPPDVVRVRYHGEIYDPPKEESSLRHVAGGRTGGTIGPEGIYLHGGTAWYPVIAPMARYSIEARVPKGWRLVGQGNRVSESEGGEVCTVRWEDPIPSTALDVVAGKFVVVDEEADGVRISAYLFEEEKHFAKLYIDASKKFIAFYSKLLGPYPYGQFSVVENWFSTGYGMPSYTLLGREVVKMAQRYTGAVGLGHEIVHNWWGNGVFVDESEGNWCEGLTTYCANYYWVEANEGEEAARKARRHMSERFTILVSPEEDFPLAEFVSKETETDNEVGYDKAAMLFHTIRRRIGDDSFWKALRAVAKEFRGRKAKWSDFGAAFDDASGVEVSPWIQTWLRTKGIPRISASLRVRDDGADVDLSMENPLPCVVPVRFDWDRPKTVHIEMPGRMGGGGCPRDGTLRRVVVDPDFHVLRRLDPVELNPCLNRVLAAKRRVVVRPTGGEAAEREVYAGLVDRLSREGRWEVVDDDVDPDTLRAASLLVLGRPGVNALLGKLLAKAALPEGVAIAPDAYEVGGKRYADPSGALLASFVSPADPSQVMTVFFGLSAESAARSQRYLFYYGWQGWYAFGPDGKAADRGDFRLGRSPLDLEPPE